MAERLFAPNERDARRIGKVVHRVEEFPESRTGMPFVGDRVRDDSYLVKIIGSTADFSLQLGVEVLFNPENDLYEELEFGITWKPVTEDEPDNAGPIRSSQDALTPIVIGSIYEAFLVYDFEGEPTWTFILPSGVSSPVFTAGSNIGDGVGVPIQFQFDIFDGFGYVEPTVCSARGAGSCAQYIVPTDRIYTVLEDAGGAGINIRMWAEIRDILALTVKESIEIDTDGKAHFVNDEDNPPGCGYYGVDVTGTSAGKGWYTFDALLNTAAQPGSITVTDNSCVFDFELDGDELNPANCTFYGKRLAAKGWHLFADMVQNSITLDAGTCKFELVNDELAPGAKFYYGTAGGVKGFHELDDAGSVITEQSITGDGLLGTEIHLVNDEPAVGEWNYYGTSTVGPGGLAWRALTTIAKDSVQFDLAGSPGFNLINDDSGPADGTLYCAFSGSPEIDHRGWHTIESILEDVNFYNASLKQLLWHSLGGGVEWVQTSDISQNSIEMDATFEVLQLVGDVDGPGNWFFYGTDNIGAKGFQEAQLVTVITGIELDVSNNLNVQTTQIRAFDIGTPSAFSLVTGWATTDCP